MDIIYRQPIINCLLISDFFILHISKILKSCSVFCYCKFKTACSVHCINFSYHFRHEKVQENCIDLVGRIADRGAEYVSAKEWMRICFELLELLKAHKKAIRRATVNTFGYIAKAIGPHDVLATLLNNLRVILFSYTFNIFKKIGFTNVIFFE